jgi:RNA polymerase sigma factor (sigma-70 family)
MQFSRSDDDSMVVAARAGDRDALNELLCRHLPVVYALVRQGLDNEHDVDDVVQDVMVRAVRQLPALKSPGSFRSWLIAITVRQIGTHQGRLGRAAGRTVALSAQVDQPDAGGDLEGPGRGRPAPAPGERATPPGAPRHPVDGPRRAYDVLALGA